MESNMKLYEFSYEYPPDGLLTLGKSKHDVAADPHIIAPDPYASDDRLDDLSPDDLYLLTTIVEPDTMNTGEAEPSSGLNGRLRPRKFNIPSPKTSKSNRKPDTKPAVDRPKRTSTPSKVSPNKLDDLTEKADSPATQPLCPYCDKTYFSKQALANHVRRTHLSTAKLDTALSCLFCNHGEPDAHDIIRHMVDSHPNQYFACYDCHTRFPSTTELAEHKLNVCDKQKLPYRNKLRQKATPKKTQKNINITGQNDFENDVKDYTEEHGFNGIVISCELKPSHVHDLADIEDNITTNFILPPGKNLINGAVVEKNAVIILDDLQWSKRGPPNFSFQNTDADQILSRLGVVHRSPRTGESTAREWLKNNDDSHQKFEKCFDTSFYSKVASNVQENLTKFLDGSCNFNPDPENTIKTRKAKNIVAINTVEGFPILLASEQFSRHGFDGYMPRAIAPKHKWKWDNLENDKSLMSPEQIKRDSHTNNCIISLVSSLDIWTQLCMRRKYETKYNKLPVQKKTEKQSMIGKELKDILESRELPASTSQVVKYTGPPAPDRSLAQFPASLGLVPTAPSFDLKPAVLSGEWVRPRCYVCCACGAQSRDSKGLSSHITAQHPNAQIQHYEIVGEVLLNSDILKHLYVPPSQVNNRTRPLRGFRECTKCRKSISIEDLHQHMLDCAGDTPAVRRKCRPRPFGVRKRRPRLPDNTIRKKMRKDIRSRHCRKNHMRPRPRIRTEVGDAETIRKMLADLPAKRHRVMVKPLNPTIRPRRNLKQTRNKLVMQKRMNEETKNSPRESSFQVPTASAGGDGSKKNTRERDDHPPGRPFRTTTKRVVSKIIRKNESFNKKSLTKSKRKIVLQKDPKAPSVVESPPTNSENDSVQVEQLSIENNPERININEGSYNTREHGSRSNNNSNNRENQSPDSNYGQNGNSGDSFTPSQNVPLKHSIASLTASSETHDKSVQFHHLFLVQQECNNVNQHVPAGQRMFFENEAVVTKLDKPPLHFNHRRQLDLQAYQKSKLNKPRKGLNDCIAMLKNKLVEPSSSTLPGHVSVQCGDDEPLDPGPIIVERRHSTTELKTDYTQRSDYVHTHIPKKDVEENVQSSTSKSRVTRRSSSTRHGTGSRGEKVAEIVSSEELMQWRQFYYDSQMLTAQNITENYTKRESSRRRNSLVPTEDLLLQHAMNLELLSKSKELTKFSEYNPYPSVSTHQNTPKKNNRRESQKNKASNNVQSTRSKTKDNVTMRGKNVELISNQPNKQPKQSHRSKTVINSRPTKRNIDRHNTKTAQACNIVAPVEKFIEPYSQAVVVEDTSPRFSIEKRVSPVNRSPDEHRPQVLSRHTPVVEYTSKNDIAPVHYTMQNEASPSGPLDLTNKITNKEDSVQYIPQEQFPAAAYDTFETLDLSHKNVGTLPVRHTHINSDEVVDLRINYAHASFQPRYTPLPPELVNNEVDEDKATDLSVRRDDDIPTDLSINRRDYSTPANPYEKTPEGHGRISLNYMRDFSNPMRHVEDSCIIVHEYLDENSERIVVVENEVPTDFSSRTSVSRSNMCIIEEPMHLNAYTNNTEPNDENVPADLSGKRRPFMASSGATITNTICNYDNYDSQQASHFMSSDQIIDCRYNRPVRTPSETNFTRSSNRRSISYGEPSQNFDKTLNTALKSFVKEDLSTNDTSALNKSKNFEQIDYSHSEMPLSLVSNLSKESTNCNPSRNSQPIETEYEMIAAVYTAENDFISATKTEPINTSATIASNVKTLSINKITETVTKTTDNNMTHGTELSETTDSLSSSDNKIPESKKLPVNSTLTTKTTCTTEADKRKAETVNVINSNTVNSDQDPETARKIAMLPKELVEILGTMPVDHRNQLLNVLPQYVSTSTSPVSHSETVRCNSRSSSESANLVNQVAKEFKYETNSKDNSSTNTLTTSSKNSQFSESSPISVSSSILLTPPTPQTSERYSLQSQESSDIQKYNTKKSRASTEEQTPSTSIDSNKLSIGSNTLAVKRLTKTIEHNDPDRVIDLTVDENSSENTEVSNLGSVIHTNMITASTKDLASTAISKSNVQKTSSDKTASLRAVRIKTPSERHRSMLSENILVNQQNKMALIINVQDDIIKESENISPMAIQKAEVSSTQHRPVLRAPEPAMVSPSEQHQKAEEKLIEKKDSDEVPIVTDNSTLVTSTLSRDMSLSFNNDCPTVTCKDNTTKTPLEAINVSFSKGTCSDIGLNDKANTIHKVSTKENIAIDKQSSLKPKDSSLIDDEDSEDDISLAVIVKQKQKDSNLVSNAHQNTKIDVQSKLSGNKKKRKPKKIKNTSRIVSGDKSLLEDNLELTKSTTTDIVSEISLTNKERGFNERNSIDKTSHGKKNARKRRRLENAQTIKYSDRKDHTSDNNAYEDEINKENNVSSEIVKISESHEESFKLKPNDQEPNLSSSVNTIINSDIDSEEREESKKMLEKNSECSQATNKISEINKVDTEKIYPVQNESKLKLPQNSLNSSSIEQIDHTDCNRSQPQIESEIVLGIADVSENLNKTIETKSDNLKLDALSKPDKSKDVSNSEKSTKSKKVSIEPCPADDVNSDLEETNGTPLRRSRRGKSLFIDSNSTMAVNPALRDKANEQRAPLTKKQLIFSKLLLDEENHNKLTFNATPVLVKENLDKTPLIISPEKAEDNIDKTSVDTHPKLIEENSSNSLIILDEVKNNLVSSITPETPEDQDLVTQKQTLVVCNNSVVKDESSEKKITNTRTTTTNKRKISPQCNRGPKKKKSFGHRNKSENTDVKLQQNVNTENEVNQNIVENKETLPHYNDVVSEIESNNDEVLVKVDTTEVNNDCVRSPTNLDSTYVIPKTLSIEKRKSCSPERQDSLQSSKAKKCKLDDEGESTEAATTFKEDEKPTELKSAKNSTVTLKNITCYNKPARRARSKSVIVKSSGAEFYDPYDIDLEDMIDKTERKEISAKMSFSSFKSSIAAKTRKLSKTTTAIIDINTEALVNDSGKVTDGQNNDSIAVHKNTPLDAKYGSSDSDDSSKSDVPLKKYAEEKEKKLAEISLARGRNKKSSDKTDDMSSWREKTKARKKNNRSISINKKEEKIEDDKIDSEKDLRSEQFMESFGFFSERKPRKSNLLATKKISETFHIIANDSDDVYFTSKDRGGKKGPTDNRKEDNKHLKGSSVSPTKKAAKRGRKKKSTTPELLEPRFCTVCKKAFRRSDNFLRHQMTLYHVSRLCEVELKVKAVIIEEEPNYLIAYKQQLERLKFLQDKIAKRKKHSLPTSDIVLPTLEEILAEVKRTIREQELSRRELSRDEALFVDCCEMLKQSHKKDIPLDNKRVRQCNSFNCPQTNQLALLEKRLDDKCELKSDEDMDAISAKNRLESDDIRNLENDLFSNFKQGNGLNGFGRLRTQSSDEMTGNVSEALATTSEYQNDFNIETRTDPVTTKPKTHPEVKNKMYPDVYDTIDMFEDKFDKIKRKCRSQAAAAKQIQTQVDPNLSHKNSKKSDRKKGKKTSKKSQNAVPTKGALKGFDGIKVSIPTSDINMSAIVPSVGNSLKKKKKNNSKRKRERKSSDVSSKSNSDHVTKDSSQRKVDVYEFLDTDDAELFEFRPSTLMERFKSINNKEMPSTSKAHVNELTHSSSESMSDGDDFVYMDELANSEDETENSVLSCEIGCGKGNGETKKASPLKRKDVIEKNAVMGKIFKHNALRSDKKSPKQFAKPKANLDQLFDSLLENEPKEQSKDEESPKEPTPPPSSFCSLSPKRKELTQSKRDELPPVVLSRKPEPSMSVTPFEELISQRNAQKYESVKEFTQPTRVPKFNPPFGKYRDVDNDDCKSKYEDSPAEDYDVTRLKSKEKDKSSSGKEEIWGKAVESPEEEVSEDGGVARQRARRKCAVGKQNVLAETWSSESEPDARPARPTSAESVIATPARRRRAKRARRPEARGPSARARLPPLGSPGETEPDHPQQHGWIVGDSHKKLVTMLAHAKGRKRSHDERRPLLE